MQMTGFGPVADGTLAAYHARWTDESGTYVIPGPDANPGKHINSASSKYPTNMNMKSSMVPEHGHRTAFESW